MKAWTRLDPLAALDRAVDVLFEVGPVALCNPWPRGAWGRVAFVVDGAVGAVLARLYEHDAASFDDLVEDVGRVVERTVRLDVFPTGYAYDLTASYLEDAFDLLERAAVVSWTGARHERNIIDRVVRRGGVVDLTAYGAACCPRLLGAAGFVCTVAPRFEVDTIDEPSEIIAALGQQLDALGPAGLCDAFDSLGDATLVERMWRVDDDATARVLDALGRHHLDKSVAKRARKAAMQHRGWRAGAHG